MNQETSEQAGESGPVDPDPFPIRIFPRQELLGLSCSFPMCETSGRWYYLMGLFRELLMATMASSGGRG